MRCLNGLYNGGVILKRIICIFLSCFLILFCFPVFSVSAEDVQTVTVQLTEAQTLALYGTSFSALYFDGSGVQNVTFDYVKSSKQICDEINAVFDSWSYNNVSYSVLPSGSVNAFSMYGCPAGGNLTGSLQGFDNSFGFNSDWLGINGGSVISRELLQYYDFLLYRANVAPRPVNSSIYDFQFNIQFPFLLSGVERFQSLFMVQIGMFTPSSCWGSIPNISNSNLRGEVRLYGTNNLVPLAVTSDSYRFGTNNYFGISYHPINTIDPDFISSIGQNVPTYNALDGCLSAFGIFSMSLLDSSVSSDLTGINWNIRAGDAQAKFLKQDFDPNYTNIIDPNDSNYQYEDDSIYIMVMCPRIQGDFVIGRPSGSAPDYSAPLNDIIDKLDIIANNLNISFDTTSLETTIENTGSSVVSGVVNGIKGLFLPSQTDILNFRGDMITLFNGKLQGLSDAYTVQNTVFNRLISASAMSCLEAPLIDLRPTVNFHLTAADFPNQSVISRDDKEYLQVPLKPYPDKFGFFYDLVASMIDIVCTGLFINMLIHKIHAILWGEKEVYLDAD